MYTCTLADECVKNDESLGSLHDGQLISWMIADTIYGHLNPGLSVLCTCVFEIIAHSLKAIVTNKLKAKRSRQTQRQDSLKKKPNWRKCKRSQASGAGFLVYQALNHWIQVLV